MMSAFAPALSFAVYLITLLVAHQVADHWVQTNHQAATKGRLGREGSLACARHVAGYTATLTAFGLLAILLLHLSISPIGFIAGQLVSAVTHYWADRRVTLRALAEQLNLTEFWTLGAPRQVAAYVRQPDGTLLEVVTYLVDTNGLPIQPEGELALPLDNPSLGTGAYALDQSFHWFALFLAALVTVLI